MAQQPHKQTSYDQFNIEIPQKFPNEGISADAASAIVNTETWTDANPMLNLSSFVTTYCEPEAKDLYDRHMFRNFADPDMYPHTAETESQVRSMAARPVEWSEGFRALRVCDDRLFRSLYAGRPGPQMELEGGSKEGGKGFQQAKYGHWRQRPDCLEKVLALFRRRAADCAAE